MRQPILMRISARRTPTIASTRQVVAFGVAVLVLFAATIVVSNARYRFGDAEIVYNADFAAGLEAWRTSGRGRATLQPVDPPVARLSLGPDAQNARLTQEFAPDRHLSHVRVVAEARTRDVAKGPKPWHTGRIVAAPFDADGAFIRGRPHVLFSETGTHDWQWHDGIFPIAGDVATVKIELQLLQASGAIEMRNLRVQEAFQVPALKKAHRLLGLCWALLVLVALFWLSRRLPRRGNWVCGTLAVAIIVLIAPRPQDHVIRPMVFDTFVDTALLAPFIGSAATVSAPAAAREPADARQDRSPQTAESRWTPAAYLKERWRAVIDVVRRFDHLDEYVHTLLLLSVAVFCMSLAGYDALALVSASLLALALLTEFLQVFSLGRTFSAGDLGYNLLGVGAGMALYLLGRQVTRFARPIRL